MSVDKIKKTRIIVVLLVVAILLSMTSCGAPKSALEKLKKDGKLLYRGSTTTNILSVLKENLQIELEYLGEVIYESTGADPDAIDKDVTRILIGIDPNEIDKDAYYVSEPYSSILFQGESAEYPIFAEVSEAFECIAIEKNDYNLELINAINDAISKGFDAKLLSLADKENAIGSVDLSSKYIYDTYRNLTPLNYDSKNILAKSHDMGIEYQDRLVILCDSPTYWLKGYGMLSDGTSTTQVWTGPTGTQTFPYYKSYGLLDPYDGSEKTMVELAKAHQPEILIVALGINGLAGRSLENYRAIYKQMICDLKEVCPDTVFVCTSMYPVTEYYKKQDIINNDLITSRNNEILKICEETGCFFLDSASVFWGEDGYARPELMKSDGLHPNREGLKLLLEYYRTHACVQK